MAIRVRWVASASASCLHAVDLLSGGKALSDSALAAALSGPTTDLLAAIESRVPRRHFLDHLVPLAAGIENNRELARVTATKTCGSAIPVDFVDRLAGLLTAAEQAFLRVVPDVVDQLALRSEPLRLQWEARGPGLLATVARRSAADLLPEAADVVLVHPVAGGAGTAHLPYNSARIEAVLANPIPELPEVVRLGWLLAQLNADLPRFQGELHRERLAIVAPLAMLPLVLAAAEEVELARCDRTALARAIEAWDLRGASPAELADAGWSWWDTYQGARPRWDVALAALDRMLPAG